MLIKPQLYPCLDKAKIRLSVDWVNDEYRITNVDGMEMKPKQAIFHNKTQI
jgi:hypothetical protein